MFPVLFAVLAAFEAFAHGAKMLFKDVQLLGSIRDPNAEPDALTIAALPFLEATGTTKGD